ncbi:SH3 domain-containing protein [Breoghania sp.]|uniref:SH3 domain-containing protein n=1 Tax=Breoghania sp. TaxID=2065378 RepID=UPI0026341C4F|nr:SH3 domain-containing protein [Breoghania sp.]MDJ0929522.1 hypothetical protein [Breoghania sp.]
MKRYLTTADVAVALNAGAVVATSADAAVVSLATANVNIRAGPSTQYPVIIVLPQGANVVTYGCLAGYTWCDVGFAGRRGAGSSRPISVSSMGAERGF